jgi:hypothetical protein
MTVTLRFISTRMWNAVVSERAVVHDSPMCRSTSTDMHSAASR